MIKDIQNKFHKAKKKLLLLDYDGTLVRFHHKPEAAVPKNEILETLKALSQIDNTSVAIISGRDKKFLEKWFSNLDIILFAEHGHFQKKFNKKWIEKIQKDSDWKKNFLPIFQDFTDRTPGTFIEEKSNCIVWHYRKTDPELANDRVVELKTVVNSLISENLIMMDGDKAIEITNVNINKGSAVNSLLNEKEYDFVLCAGDDISDENMFINLPEKAFSIKVGRKATKAKYFLEGPSDMINLLKKIT